MPLSGILTGWISWQAPFYFYGTAGLIWYGFWLWLSFEKPRYNPTISLHELKYIEKSLGDSVQLAMPKISTTPWREFARSMPVYAIIVANFCRSWNFYLLVLYQSAYLKHTFNFKIGEVGSVSEFIFVLFKQIISLTDWCSGGSTSFTDDNYCTFWRNVGRLSEKVWNSVNYCG